MSLGDDQCNQNQAGNQHPMWVALSNIVVLEAKVRNVAHHQRRQAVND
jgi:hypothetical protein